MTLQRFLIVIVFLSSLCVAQHAGENMWAPPLVDWGDIAAPATAPRKMVTSIRISGMSINLEKTMLKDVQHKYGGEIGFRGQTAEAEDWLCFTGGDANGRFALWLESGEMNGGSVGSFQLRQIGLNEV